MATSSSVSSLSLWPETCTAFVLLVKSSACAWSTSEIEWVFSVLSGICHLATPHPVSTASLITIASICFCCVAPLTSGVETVEDCTFSHTV